MEELRGTAGLLGSVGLISLLWPMDQILILQRSMKIFTLAFSGTLFIVLLIQMH